MVAHDTAPALAPGPIRWAMRQLHRIVDAVDRHVLVCIIAGLAIAGLLSWYVVWHVPNSTWLFSSQYAQPFKDLVYRIIDIKRVQHGGTLYSPKDHLEYFVYPPAAAWMFWPLTWVGLFTGELLWTLTSILALAWMIASLGRFACRWRWSTAWAVSLLIATPISTITLQPVGVHLALGQVGLYLAAAATFDILCVRDQRFRGFLTGVTAAIKIYPLIYLFIFLLKREWRALANAVAGVVATTVLGWIAFPKDSATFFFHRLLSGRELRHYWHNAHWISSSSSLYTFMFRQPFDGNPIERNIGFLMCVAVILLGIYATWRQLRESREAAALLCVALASTIGSPVAWDHYFVWVVFVPFVLVERGQLPWWRQASLWLFVLACLIPLRIARNENLSHRGFDWVSFVIFMARDGLIAVSLLWIIVAAIPIDRWRRPDAQPSSATIASHQALSAG